VKVETVELKPCPFCGGKAETSEVYDYDDRRYYLADVGCDGPFCSVKMNDGLSWGDYVVLPKEERSSVIKRFAAEAWNKRYIEDTLRARAEKAEARGNLLANCIFKLRGNPASMDYEGKKLEWIARESAEHCCPPVSLLCGDYCLPENQPDCPACWSDAAEKAVEK